MKLKIRRILYVTLMLFILSFIGNKAKAATVTANGATFTYDLVNGKAENVWISARTEDFTGAIPETLDGYTVVSIGNGEKNIFGNKDVVTNVNNHLKFPELDIVTKIEIPNTVTKINDYAFYSVGSKQAYTIPSSVVTIGKYAFAESHTYDSNAVLTIPDSVETIGEGAFSNRFTAEVIDRSAVTNSSETISDAVYKRIAQKIIFGSGIKEIGDYAFAYQPRTTGSIVIPSTTTKIGINAFRHSGFTTLNFADRTSEVTVGNYAFAYSALTSVTLKEHVTIGEAEFMGCHNLDDVSIPQTLTKLPNSTFYSCTSLSSQTANSILSNVTQIGNSVFFNCIGLTSDVVIPSTVTSMGTSVFYGCRNLEKATINATIQTLPDSTFRDCRKLNDVTLSNTIKTLGYYSFEGCTSITTDELHDILTNISQINGYAFRGCTGLTGTLELNSILGGYAFENCTNIEGIHLKAGTNTYSSYDGVFSKCEKLKNVEIDDGVYISISNNYFYGCKSLDMENLNVILGHAKIIGSGAFKDCTGLEGELHIPSNITYISDSVFYNDTGITKIIFDDCDQRTSSLTIGNKTFGNIATSQDVIYLPEMNTMWSGLNIGDNAFSNIEEAFVDMDGTNIAYNTNRWWGTSSNKPFVHYNDCTHNVSVSCSLPGVSIVDSDNNVVSSNDVACQEDYTFKLVIDEAYANSYPDLTVKIISEGKFINSDSVTETIDIEPGVPYTIENVTRAKRIIVQAKSEGTDLVLRQYISKLNENELRVKRTPNANISGLGISEYKHTKYPVIVKKNDIITYAIRVYNEGSKVGKANEITVRIPDGLTFDSNNQLNSSYEWTVSEDGKSISTKYLENDDISAYNGSGRPNYKEIEYTLRVEEDSNTDLYMVTLAEITEGNDVDSVEKSAADISLDNLMYDESIASNSSSYIYFSEDDTDYEDVLMEGKASTEYSLVINKIDSKTDELLNGAKFELLDENEEVIKSATTINGKIDFGSILTYGEGTDTYYLREVETPVGYKKTIDGLMEISVVKTINSTGEIEITIYYDLKEIEDEEDVDDGIDEEEEIIPIYNQQQLSKIGTDDSIAIDGTEYTFSKDANYKLMNDIEISGENWPGIDDFSGVFNGNNHKISGLRFNTDNGMVIGFFKKSTGRIINLTIDDAKVTGTGTTEMKMVGIFVAYMPEGSIENCKLTNSNIYAEVNNVGGFVGHTSQKIVLKNCSTDENTTIRAKYNVGGLVGCSQNQIDIINCTNAATVSGTDYNIGGLVGFGRVALNIKNSSNSGTITGDIESFEVSEGYYSYTDYRGTTNLGGLVGYVSDSTVINANNCSNSGNVNGLTNIGGLIGYSEGISNVIECTNSGTIQGTKHNIGGLIGHAEPKGTASMETLVNMDENHVINLYIKNKSTQGKYLLNVYALDTSSNEKVKLSGAKFSIYNANKDVIAEDEEVDENGNISIDNNILNSLVSDVFFIKETEAPEGYESLVKDYIMLKVEKTWNAETEKYEISGVSQIVVSMDEADVSENEVNNANGVEMPNEAGTGTTAEKSNNQTSKTIYYKSAKIYFETCTNSGNVIRNSVVNGGAAGGIVGLARGFVEIYNCDNTATIVAMSGYRNNGTAGGVVGELSINTLSNTAIISGCNNSGAITSTNAGGIVGTTGSILTIENCENAGTITTNMYNAGGIIGTSLYHTTVYKCSNTGSFAGRYIGGIVGATSWSWGDFDYKNLGFYIPNEYLCIEDCTVTTPDNTLTGGAVGGLIGFMGSEENYIRNCTIKDLSIGGTSSESASAVIGTYHGAELTVEDCIVQDCTIGAGVNAGGIVGGQYGWHGVGSEMKGQWDRQIYNYNNIKILGTTVEGGNASGVMAVYFSGGSYAPIVEISATNCYVGASDKNEKSTIKCTQGSGHAAGIFGSMYASTYGITTNLKFTDCEVENADIIGSNDRGVAGIMGYIYELQGEIDFTNCHVRNSNLIAKTDHIAGIYGGDYACKEVDSLTVVDNCTVEDTNFIIDQQVTPNPNGNAYLSAYTSGSIPAIGTIIGEGYDRYDIKRISNSNVKNVTINLNGFPSNVGMIGFIYGCSAELYNCTVEGVDIKNAAGKCSFGVGELTACNILDDTFIVKDFTVKGYKKADGTIKKNTINSNDYLNFSMGSILGTSYYIHNVDLEDIDISDVEFKGNSSKVGGFAGGFFLSTGSDSTAIFKNINLDNIDIDVSIKTYNYGTNVGGVFGEYNDQASSTTSFNSMSLTNSSITTRCPGQNSVGGIVGSYGTSGKSSMSDITVSNVDIDVTGTCEVGGVVGNRYFNGDQSYDDIKISNLDITARDCKKAYAMVAAMIADSYKDAEISNVEIKNSSVVFEDGEVPVHVAGIVAGTYGYNNISDIDIDGLTLVNNSSTIVSMTGGIMGYDVYNSTIKDSTVKNITITGKNVGGVAGGANLSNISNITVKNANINGSSYAGGIVALLLGNTQVTGATVTADVDSETAYVIYSDGITGGIAAIDNGLIKDSKVENITIKSNVEATEDIIEDEDGAPVEYEIGNAGSAGIIHGLFINEAIDCTSENVTVIQGE